VGTSSALIVVERDRQRDLVTRFFEDTGVDFQGDVVQMQTLFRLEVVDYDDIVLLAAPKRISDNYMRALLLGGVTPKAKFLCSNWLAGHEPQKVEQDLLPGLPGVKKLAFNVVGPPLSSTFQSISQEEFEEFQILPLASDFEKFSGGGAVPCRLIQLANGHVMPVELKAKKVSVLKTNDDGEFTVEYRTPGKDLEAGDILFELRDGAEEDFLMDQAQISMGKAFHEFSKGRSDWKRRVGDLIAAHGKGNVIRQLKAAGVGTAKYLDDWLGNVDFTTPRAKKDWHNLLVALKFAPSEISRLEALGKDLRAKLIAVGLKARSHMADAVDSTELSAIRNREIVTKQLDGFGDAVFILAMVEDPDAGASTCEQHEIRKVLKA
jgi:hypothetical protein